MKLSKYLLWIIVIIMALFLCACQPSPSAYQVISKNDGTFNANAVETATVPCDIDMNDATSKNISVYYDGKFQSTDNSVDFEFHISENIQSGILPIVEVVPHFLTGEDAKRVAEVLFGGTEFFEAQPNFATVYSKSEIKEKLNRWAHYTSDSAIEALFGSP